MVRSCKAFLPILQDQAIRHKHVGARIINLVSVAGLAAMPGGTAYAASKHAATALTSGLRGELKSFGIQVSAVNPSFHDTPIHARTFDHWMSLWKGLPTEIREKYGEGM